VAGRNKKGDSQGHGKSEAMVHRAKLKQNEKVVQVKSERIWREVDLKLGGGEGRGI